MVVFGWGFLFWKISSLFIGTKTRIPLWGELGFYGLFTIGILATCINFFFPINLPILIFISITGLLLSFGFLFQGDEASGTLTKGFVLLSLSISFFFTLFAAYNHFDYDAGLYHLPYQLWMRKEPVVLGLANFHDRFGFNSILDAIFAIFWLSNKNFILICYVQSFFIFFFYLTLLEFLLRNPDRNWVFSVSFSLLSPLSLLILDDYVVYLVTSTDTPAAMVALSGVFSFFRLADKLRRGKTVEAEFLSLNVLAAFAMALKLSSVPILVLVVSSYILLFRRTYLNWPFFIRVGLLSALTLIPTISRNVAVSGCLFFPVAFSCFSELPWSAEPSATRTAEIITAFAKAPVHDFWRYTTGWDWVPLWIERHFELLLLLMASTFVIFMCAYFHSWVYLKRKFPLEATKMENKHFLPTMAILLVTFESIAVAFWFLNAPDVRFGIMALHMFTLFPALLIVSLVEVGPQPAVGRSFLYTLLGILLIVSCILKISNPLTKDIMHTSHLFEVSLHVPVVETVPTPPFGVRPVKPDDHNCWVTEEPCQPYPSFSREFDIGRIGMFKAFLPK